MYVGEQWRNAGTPEQKLPLLKSALDKISEATNLRAVVELDFGDLIIKQMALMDEIASIESPDCFNNHKENISYTFPIFVKG
ncbi:hypothetical protein NS365_07460 [Aureimonas ureilytica]|uniref:Uncharacterized protein n=2 Tax=Aureimonas ureilytica TaxID=401562 RepID=A0A175RSI3_9HYPH|nr:hypothetical protein NS365_07460 [Aureimonas ureilytica]